MTNVPTPAEIWWLGFVTVKDMVTPHRHVQQFNSEKAATDHRSRVKSNWGLPNRVSTAFRATTEDEALTLMDRY